MKNGELQFVAMEHVSWRVPLFLGSKASCEAREIFVSFGGVRLGESPSSERMLNRIKLIMDCDINRTKCRPGNPMKLSLAKFAQVKLFVTN